MAEDWKALAALLRLLTVVHSADLSIPEILEDVFTLRLLPKAPEGISVPY
jgi:hypothetical protein